MEPQRNRFGVVKAFLATCLAAGLLASGFAIRDCSADAESRALQDYWREQVAADGVKLETSRHHATTLERALRVADRRHDLVKEHLVRTQADVRKLQYLVASNGKLEAPPPTIVTVERNVPAPSHKFRTVDDLLVAELITTQSELTTSYQYAVYELDFQTSIVITDKQASVDVQVASAAEPDKYVRVVQKTESWDTSQKHKLLKPQLLLGATLAADLTPQLGGSLGLNWLHPHPAVDVLSPRVTGTPDTFYFGIDALHYNVGDPIPVLENLWIGVGANVSHRGEFSGALTLGAKL
jgi:hypothetical protein